VITEVIPQATVFPAVVTVLVTFRQVRQQQPCLYLKELPFIDKELKQLVQRQATATCKSLQSALPSHLVVIHEHTLTTDADFHRLDVYIECIKHVLLT